MRNPKASITGPAGSWFEGLAAASSRFRSRRTQHILGFLAVSIAFAGGLQAQSRADEYRNKAAFVRNFGRFVEWPAQSLPARGPLTVGFVGDGNFGDALEEELRGKLVNGHPLRFRHLRWNQDLSGCHILVVNATEAQHLPNILRVVGTESVLTVSDLSDFALHGGMIELVVAGNRTLFDINRQTALNARLKIDSKLLSAARQVYMNDSVVKR